MTRPRHLIRSSLIHCAMVFSLAGCRVVVGMDGPGVDGGTPDLAIAGDGALADHGGPDLARPDLATDCPAPLSPVLRHFTIIARNDTMSDRYVIANSCNNDVFCNHPMISDGACLTYGVSRGGAALDLLMNFKVVCEGPGVPSSNPGGLHRVAPGAMYTVGYWTGSSLHTCSRPVDCATRGWPQGGIVNVVEGLSQDVVPGLYTITVPVENTVPNNCKDTGNDFFGCTWNNQFDHPVVMPTCKTSTSASIQFTLPDAGDATVIVPITK